MLRIDTETVGDKQLAFFSNAKLALPVKASLDTPSLNSNNMGGEAVARNIPDSCHTPVSRISASRYLAAVFASTSAGSLGPGGVLSQTSVSR
jgi:hypothetical protein